MTDLVVGALDGRPIHFLDVSPMITALRTQPTDFEFTRGWLRHVPTRHRFHFDRKGNVTIEAHCGCAGMSVRADQGTELYTTFNLWREDYWQPLLRNREFADHFRTPNAWVRLWRDVRMALRRFRGRAEPVTLATFASESASVAAVEASRP